MAGITFWFKAYLIKCFLTLLLLRRGFLGWEKIFILVTFSKHLIILLQENRGITLPTKVHIVKAMVFFRSHVWMWEGWVLKNWCFWTVVLEKTFESPLGCKEIQPVNPQGNQSWMFIGRTDAEASILWPPDAKSLLYRKDPDARKDWGKEEKGVTEDKIVGWLSLPQWKWVLADSGRWWRSGKPGVL